MTRFRLMVLPLAVVLALCLAGGPAAAKVGGGAKAPKATTSGPKFVGGSAKHGGSTAGAPKVAKGSKSLGSKSVANKGASGKTTGGAGKSKTATTNPSKPSLTTGDAASDSRNTRGVSKSGSADPAPTTLNKAQQQLTKNTNLRQKIESRLPPGTDVIAAASDFRNLGQFQAAVNASYNQGYSFEALKALMTGPNPLSLGQAKQQLKGTTNAGATGAGTATGVGTTGVGTTGVGTPTGAGRPTGVGTTGAGTATGAGTPTTTSTSQKTKSKTRTTAGH